MLKLVAALVALCGSGCHLVFSFEPIPDAAIDASVDGPADAPPDVALANHDEDGDSIDDAVDNCPGTPNAQGDGDNDGVGDVCDPHPTLKVDRLRYFSSLQSFVGWTPERGTWTEQPEGDSVSVASGSGSLLATLDLGMLKGPTVIVTIAEASGTDYGAYLVTGSETGVGDPSGLSCYEYSPTSALYVYDTRTGTAMQRSTDNGGGIFPLEISLQSSTPKTGQPTGSPSCAIARTGGLRRSVTPADTAPITAAKIGLYTFEAAATFTSVTVIERL